MICMDFTTLEDLKLRIELKLKAQKLSNLQESKFHFL